MVNHMLQLFAEAAPGGGEAGAAGVMNADAGHTESAAADPSPARMRWEDIRKDPEYSAEISKIVRERLKEAGTARQTLDTLLPGLKNLARQQGMDPENPDYQALAEVLGRPSPSPAPADSRFLDLHFRSLEQQSRAMKSQFPGFDLGKELQNKTFARLVSPRMGMSVEDAYHAVHRREIQAAAMQVAAQKTAQQISNAIRSGSLRPQEGTTPAPAVTGFDYAKMSKEQRTALKNRIYRGERIFPGQF